MSLHGAVSKNWQAVYFGVCGRRRRRSACGEEAPRTSVQSARRRRSVQTLRRDPWCLVAWRASGARAPPWCTQRRLAAGARPTPRSPRSTMMSIEVSWLATSAWRMHTPLSQCWRTSLSLIYSPTAASDLLLCPFLASLCIFSLLNNCHYLIFFSYYSISNWYSRCFCYSIVLIVHPLTLCMYTSH